MESITQLLPKIELSKGGRSPSWRDEYIDTFTDRLNIDRKLTSFKRYKLALRENKELTIPQFKKSKDYLRPLSKSFVAIKISHIKSQQDMHFFLKRCQEARNFSEMFWGMLKPKPIYF